MIRKLWAVMVLAVAAGPGVAEPPLYTVTVIGGVQQPAPSGPVSLPLALNNNGRVVGYGYNAGGNIQALNWKAGVSTSLGGTSLFTQTFANRVNVLGRIAGTGYRLDASGNIIESHALKWTGGVMSDLGNLGGSHAAALAINDYEQVVGFATLPGDGQVRAFIYQNGLMSPIASLPGATESYAYDISNNGYVVGAAIAGGPARPFIWRAGSSMALTIPLSSRTGAANAVNEFGQVVGTYEIDQYTGAFAAVLWQGPLRYDLGYLGGPLAYATAADINNLSQIVGTSNSQAGHTGFIWQAGRMYDLRAYLASGPGSYQITSATSINDRGQVAAAALINGRQMAVLLTPVGQ